MADPITDKLFNDAIWGKERHRIVLCTTLRDFDEDVPEGESMSENCQMQELFLRCVARQTHQNYRLVVTTFGDKSPQPLDAFNKILPPAGGGLPTPDNDVRHDVLRREIAPER